MLTITVRKDEYYDENLKEFFFPESFELQLEHSLVSLSKWESKFKKPFLSNTEPTEEETAYYIYCMVLTPGFEYEHLTSLSIENFQTINDYINDPMTATTFHDQDRAPRSRETITSELIYYWMTVFNIPKEFENWHLNRLFTLIKVCNLKNAKPKKMSRSEILARNRALNEERLKKYGTTG
jgi:hypothetical protein